MPCWFTSALAMAAMSYLFWQRLLNLALTALRWERIVRFIRCLCRRTNENAERKAQSAERIAFLGEKSEKSGKGEKSVKMNCLPFTVYSLRFTLYLN